MLRWGTLLARLVLLANFQHAGTRWVSLLGLPFPLQHLRQPLPLSSNLSVLPRKLQWFSAKVPCTEVLEIPES